MTEATIPLRPRAEDMTPEEIGTQGYWGFCPDCHRLPNGYINMGKDHFFICPACRVYWFVGSNFLGWPDETEQQQRATYDRMGIADFRPAKSAHYPEWSAMGDTIEREAANV